MQYLEDNDRLFIYSDGLTESINSEREMFGQQRVEQIVRDSDDADTVFDQIKQGLAAFCAGSDKNDDVTLAEVRFDPAKLYQEFNAHAYGDGASIAAGHWEFHLNLQADVLRNADPLPVVIQAITEIQGLNSRRQQLYTILAELYSNALEHGLLGLDSALKTTAEGFTEYYQRRQDSLAALRNGEIDILVRHEASASGGRMTIRVQDSGLGFDYGKLKNTESMQFNLDHSGRGVPLLDSFCESVTYHGCGNVVEAVYCW